LKGYFEKLILIFENNAIPCIENSRKFMETIFLIDNLKYNMVDYKTSIYKISSHSFARNISQLFKN